MKRIIIETKDSIDYNFLIEEINNRKIDYRERILSDSSFPSISNNTYGEITISYDYKVAITEILTKNSDKDYRIKIITQGNRMKKYFQLALMIYAIVITLFFVKYWHLYHQNSNDKNFELKWNHSNTILSFTNKKSGHLASRYIDSNYNFNFERSEIYVDDKGPTSILYDSDENGYYDEILYFDFSGNPVGVSKDYDADGSFDFYELITEENDTLIFVDKNKDGQMEWSNRKNIITNSINKQ